MTDVNLFVDDFPGRARMANLAAENARLLQLVAELRGLRDQALIDMREADDGHSYAWRALLDEKIKRDEEADAFRLALCGLEQMTKNYEMAMAETLSLRKRLDDDVARPAETGGAFLAKTIEENRKLKGVVVELQARRIEQLQAVIEKMDRLAETTPGVYGP